MTDIKTLKLYGFQPDMLPDELVLRKDTRAFIILIAAAIIGLAAAVLINYVFEDGSFEDFTFDWDLLLGALLAVLASPLITFVVERFIPDDMVLSREGFRIQGSMEEPIPWHLTGMFEVAPRSFWVSQVFTYVAEDHIGVVSQRLLKENSGRLVINAVFGGLSAEDLARVMNAYRSTTTRFYSFEMPNNP